MSAISDSSPRIALAHDYLNQRGGAERVALELTRIWPCAPLYTSLYRPTSTFPEFSDEALRPSFLDRIPVDARFRALAPLLPAAFAALGPVDADVLVASSSGWAHSLRVRPPGRVVVYCHSPARWLYGEPYLGKALRTSGVLRPLLPVLRRWDQAAAARAHSYIANSQTTRERIRVAYGIEAAVVYPPVDVDRFSPTPRGERLLCVSRLLPYKRVDIVVTAATRAGIGLDVVGAGPTLDDLRRVAGATVTFHGVASDETVTELMESCRAFCLPGVEDFGITSVEAHAAGKPVIAFAAGGALETVTAGVTGSFFSEHTDEAFLDAVRRCDAIPTPPEEIAYTAQRFSRATFAAKMVEQVRRVVAL